MLRRRALQLKRNQCYRPGDNGDVSDSDQGGARISTLGRVTEPMSRRGDEVAVRYVDNKDLE